MFKPRKLVHIVDILVWISFVLFVLLFVFTMVTSVILTLDEEEAFIVKEKFPYVIESNYGNTPNLSTTIDRRYYNGSSYHIEEKPKEAVLIRLYVFSIPSVFILLFCSYHVKKVIKDFFFVSKAFNYNQVRRIRLISIVVTLYYLFIHVIVQVVYSIWLGYSVFYIENFRISAFLYGGLIYLLGEVFRHGVYLQETMDMRLVK